MQEHERNTIYDRLELLIENSDTDLGMKVIEGDSKIHVSEVTTQDIIRMTQDILLTGSDFLIKRSGAGITVIRKDKK